MLRAPCGSADVSRPAAPSERAFVVRRCVWLTPGLILAPGLPQGRNHLRRQGHPPRPTRGDLESVECTRLAPIGDRGHRHVEEGSRCLSTRAPIATLAVGRSRWPQRTATRDTIGMADPLHLPCRKCSALATAIALVIETRCDVEVGMVRGPLPHPLDHLRVRTADHRGPLRARHFHGTPGMGLPAHVQPNGRLELGEGHILHQKAHHLFPFGLRRRVRLPHRGQIVRSGDDPVALGLTDVACRQRRHRHIVSLKLIDRRQFLVPVAFETPCHQTIFGLYGLVTPPGQVGLIARPLEPQLPLVLNGAGLDFEMLNRLQGDGQLRGFDRRSQELRHRRINAITAYDLTSFARKIFVQLGTDIQRTPAIRHVTHRHAPAAHATHHEALQQRPPCADRATSLRGVKRPILVELRQIVMKLFPTDIAGVMIAQENRPLLPFDLAAVAFHAGGFSGQGAPSRRGASVHIRPRVEGIV